ncbi:hypothetical protein [Umezawaea tangerina]|uniref:Uncharacterized protein n=1 Tax=Umezawaea tangerina TaxID=84725 RepID=A0A2T0TJF5_9PSEU|nr:hypothetical protein [Umezawaea tangerina]PRY45852.1 hypothetical protein CLV43_101112 [Umezawaea tangerina]
MSRDDDHNPRKPRASSQKPATNALVYKLTSTESITKQALHLDEQGLARRKLSLFLATTLVDHRGTMTTAYRAVKDRWEMEAGHWAYGKNVNKLQSECGKFVGTGIEARPLDWAKIRDLLVANQKEDLIPQAAYLFRRAANIGESELDDVKAVTRPEWDVDGVEVVTSLMIGGHKWALQFWDFQEAMLTNTQEVDLLKAHLPVTYELIMGLAREQLRLDTGLAKAKRDLEAAQRELSLLYEQFKIREEHAQRAFEHRMRRVGDEVGRQSSELLLERNALLEQCAKLRTVNALLERQLNSATEEREWAQRRLRALGDDETTEMHLQLT